ncbi:thiosulfate sulfurtransferase [Faunimonas pinastri]|uniref:Thiosulfate sulfurtransferase n=1 Tax=Faunimonas pinastri TaxID=1855383 RepID=A0A1H9HQP8_9HYPH|nr:rhodanese-like domain-containing protein [Faunimonas pinastri]SEQ64552.1 thiosulfate sulfurtransferase [Faunimonas pinastri]
MSQGSYFADISPEDAWTGLANEPRAVLVDVRTVAEWSYVGLPDLSGLERRPLLVEWQSFPDMTVNQEFVGTVEKALAAADLGTDAPIYFLCRSGARSKSAAAAMTAAGFTHCCNVLGGFEGQRDVDGHRGGIDGWKAVGLPWSQS